MPVAAGGCRAQLPEPPRAISRLMDGAGGGRLRVGDTREPLVPARRVVPGVSRPPTRAARYRHRADPSITRKDAHPSSSGCAEAVQGAAADGAAASAVASRRLRAQDMRWVALTRWRWLRSEARGPRPREPTAASMQLSRPICAFQQCMDGSRRAKGRRPARRHLGPLRYPGQTSPRGAGPPPGDGPGRPQSIHNRLKCRIPWKKLHHPGCTPVAPARPAAAVALARRPGPPQPTPWRQGAPRIDARVRASTGMASSGRITILGSNARRRATPRGGRPAAGDPRRAPAARATHGMLAPPGPKPGGEKKEDTP